MSTLSDVPVTPTPPRSRVPERKVVGGGVAGAVTTIAVWIVGEAWGVTVPGEVAACVTTVVSFAVAYMVPNAEV